MNAVGIPLLVAALVAAQDIQPPAGKTDYQAALNDILSRGISPERNANVLLWKALGPTPEGARMPAEFFERLGLPEPPKEGNYFVGITEYVKDHLKLDRDDWRDIFDQQGGAMKRPWAAKDYPHVAAWLALNEKPLAVVLEATRRPDYYNPLVARRTDKDPGSLINALLPGVQKSRELAAALCARAMLRVEEGKTDDAWRDLQAAHRLGRLVARGGTLIESLVGIAVDAVASSAELAYLERAKLDSKQILARLKDRQSLPPMPPLADKIETGERHTYHDSLQLISRGADPAAGPGARKPTEEELRALAAIDWDGIRRDADKWYGRMAAALRIKDRAEREKAFDEIDKELEALVRDSKRQKDALEKLGPGGDVGAVVGKSIGNTLLALLVPSIRKVQQAYDRSEQTGRNLQIAFALAAFRADTGRYPAKLDELAPKYLAAVPDDLFTGKPLVYKPTATGYQFYSFGVDGKDDGGRWVDDDPKGDDPGVRMPLKK
jgi:hypothetical protein